MEVDYLGKIKVVGLCTDIKIFVMNKKKFFLNVAHNELNVKFVKKMILRNLNEIITNLIQLNMHED